uniref:Uncharacterized protein n=1 Tax=Ignisphaera aggregans TaxID=334771 RepID=A0A7J2U1L2_9CREN
MGDLPNYLNVVKGIENIVICMEASIRGWLIRCTNCGTKWVLEVSFDLKDSKLIYHYCKVCRKNTFHEVLGRAEKMNVG